MSDAAVDPGRHQFVPVANFQSYRPVTVEVPVCSPEKAERGDHDRHARATDPEWNRIVRKRQERRDQVNNRKQQATQEDNEKYGSIPQPSTGPDHGFAARAPLEPATDRQVAEETDQKQDVQMLMAFSPLRPAPLRIAPRRARSLDRSATASALPAAS